MNNLISVIIPVYNGEDYIGNCLRAVREQTYHNLQIIVINDGSQDDTLSICQKQAGEDSRIHLLTLENSGVSAARNAGLEIAAGDFISFVDSDDYPEVDFIQRLAENADAYQAAISICSYYFLMQGKKYPITASIEQRKGLMNREQFYEGMMQNSYRGFLWNKLFRRSLLLREGGRLLQFQRELAVCEDLLYVVEAARQGEIFYYDEQCLYNYVQRAGSASNAAFYPGKLSEIDSYNQILEIISHEVPGCLPQYEQAYLNMALKLYDSYSHAPLMMKNELTNRALKQAVERYYGRVMTQSDIRTNKKMFYYMYCRYPRIIRTIKNIHHQLIYGRKGGVYGK